MHRCVWLRLLACLISFTIELDKEPPTFRLPAIPCRALQPFSDPPASTLGCRLFPSPVSKKVYAHCSSLQGPCLESGTPELSQSTQSLRGLRLTSLDPPGSGNCLENPRISSSILLSTVVSHQLPHYPPLAIAIVLLLDTRREPPPQTTGH